MSTSSNQQALIATPRSHGPVAGHGQVHCRVFTGTGSTGPTAEVSCLLRKRLLVASLIALGPHLYFLTLGLLLLLTGTDHLRQIGIGLHTLVTLLTAGVAWVLWRNKTLSFCRLRKLELVLFGGTLAFFAWGQFVTCCDPYLWEPLRAGSEHERRLVSDAMMAGSIRYFFLIVLYGVFIPNTTRRCAVLTGLAALTAVGISAFAYLHQPRLEMVGLVPLLNMAVVLAVACAIAVFGSYRIHYLEREASHARKLGQYQLLERLGSGGMGEVYLAEHLMLRRPCAIKLIHPDHVADAHSLSRFEREVKAMATLTHWNTVEVYDYGQTEDGTFYYVMEYLPGQNLESLVTANGPLPPGRVVHLLRQVCNALREAHLIGMLHRDIKPSNVIACERGGIHDVVKLLDFGLVRCLNDVLPDERITLKGTILGSPPFMSPEQARGRGDLKPSSDIYGVGAVAYFLLTGRPPFLKETVMETLIAHATEPPAPPRQFRPDIPADLEAVVLRCLEKDPARRYQSAQELERALASCECAGEWTEELAAEWWRNHGETVPVNNKHTPGVRLQTTAIQPALPV